jgi:hypothetical protein
MRSLRSRACGLALLASLLLLASGEQAGAVSSVAPAARGLQASRLYVAPDVAETLDRSERKRIAGLLAKRSEPILVALVGFARGDAFGGDGPRFLTALAGRLQRPAIYVTYDARGILWTRGYRTSRDVDGRAEQASRVVDLEDRFDSLPAQRITHFLQALDDPDLTGREARASAAFRKRTGSITVPASTTSAREGKGGGGISGGLIAAIVAAVVLLGVAVLLLARRRRGARPVDDRPVLPGRVFSLARAASRDDLAERADAMLIALSSLIDAAPQTANTQRALDAYEAAERVLGDGKRDIPDLVGALVCIDAGREALSPGGDEPPPCTYDPRHGPAHGDVVTVDGTKLRLCNACRRDVAAGRRADVLRDGHGHPYFEDDTPWARSGYGAWGDPVAEVLGRRRQGS